MSAPVRLLIVSDAPDAAMVYAARELANDIGDCLCRIDDALYQAKRRGTVAQPEDVEAAYTAMGDANTAQGELRALLRRLAAAPAPDRETLTKAIARTVIDHLPEPQFADDGTYLDMGCSCGEWLGELQSDGPTFGAHVANAILDEALASAAPGATA